MELAAVTIPREPCSHGVGRSALPCREGCGHSRDRDTARTRTAHTSRAIFASRCL